MKVTIATGGSGGHIFPALEVAEELKRRGHHVIFLGVFGKTKEWIKAKDLTYYEITARGLVSNSLNSMLTFSFSMLRSVLDSIKVLRRLNPDVVVGFGGYGAFPVVLSASFLKIPTMIHEQNVLPGRANAVLSKMVNRIAVSFEESRHYFPVQRTVLTGCPIRKWFHHEDKEKIFAEFKLRKDLFTILVLGGSQGSHRINSLFVQTIPFLTKSLKFQVIHLSGERDYQILKELYPRFEIPYALLPFLEEMNKAYQVADLVISRAGAVTVTEIAMFGLPAILIPYPYAGGHQKENAMALTRTKTAQLIEENHLTVDKLLKAILIFNERPLKKDEIYLGTKGIYHPKATQKLAEEIVQLKGFCQPRDDLAEFSMK